MLFCGEKVKIEEFPQNSLSNTSLAYLLKECPVFSEGLMCSKQEAALMTTLSQDINAALQHACK